MQLDRPVFDQPHYGAHLGDVGYWSPYVRDVLCREGLPEATIECGQVGSFPTFLVGDVVVKLFAPVFDGPACWAVEAAMYELLAGHREVPAPGLVASGQLWGDEPAWPYLVSGRLTGRALVELDRTDQPSPALAEELGTAVAALHRLTPPEVLVARDLVPDLRATAAARLASFGLPGRLIEQVEGFLVDAEPATVLVHADITADHVFVAEGRLEGIIDWGDAMVADRSYELAATAMDALGGNRQRLRRFLDGYGWRRDDTFPHRALQGLLEFQFNIVDRMREHVDLDAIATLDQLAERLFGDLGSGAALAR